MIYWKVRLDGMNGDVELRSCHIAKTLDAAIADARSQCGSAFANGGVTGQALSELEMSDPMQAERIFIDTGNFDAYLRDWKA